MQHPQNNDHANASVFFTNYIKCVNLSILKRISLLSIFLSLFICTASASYPLLRNFSRTNYNAGTQNWAIAQDYLGQLYFGNSKGLLAFDSRNWEATPNANLTTIRSILIDDDKKHIYTGASEDFGYYKIEALTGQLKYHSLLSTLENKDYNFNEIWNIYKDNESIWFQGDFHIFLYNGKKTKVFPIKDKISTSAFINNRLYFVTPKKGICTLIDDKIVPLEGCELINDKKVCALLPYTSGNILIATSFDGLFYHDGTRARVFESDINEFLKENQTFCAKSSGKEIVFGTVNCGAVIKSLVDNSNTYINIETGLQNNTVLNAFFDKSGDIWLGLDNGICYVIYNSPISNLLGTTNVYGAGYASMLLNNTLYMGTNQGLYSSSYPIKSSPNPPVMKPLLNGQVWSIDTIGSDIFVSNDAGLFVKQAGKFTQIESIPGSWSIKNLKHYPNHALVSTYDNFYLLKKVNQKWVFDCKVKGYDDIGGHVIEDEYGYIWISHWMKGIYRLRFSHNYTSFDEVKLFNHTNGLPSDINTSIYMIDDALGFGTNKGHFTYNYKTGEMKPNDKFNDLFKLHPSRLYQSSQKDIWSVSGDYIRTGFKNASGSFDIDSVSFLPLREKLIAGFDNFNFTKSGLIIVSNIDGFYEVDPAQKGKNNCNNPIFISHIYANQDSLIYSADCNNNNIQIPYSLNSLLFEFISPEFRTENGVTYSYYLKDYDSGWSSYTPAGYKEYTQLHEGKYTLYVRAINMYNGATSECSITFSITPPWYRNIVAKIIYLIIAIITLFLIYRAIKLSSRRAAIAVAKRKEKEIAEMKRKSDDEALRKDYEIAHLKSEQLEHDFKHKSEELSNITMNVIRKNEILLDLSSMISKIQESSDATTSKQLIKVQHLIRENISHDDDWLHFTRNFDIVYENYLKRLLELHPGLSASDQRICAYLKMGLSSKDIAPLLNISFRSVEMSRYRLRKKMELNRDVNLVEYLQRLDTSTPSDSIKI